MEPIQRHEVKDVYRVAPGLLVEVNKYQPIGSWHHGKRPEKRVRGCKGLTILQESFQGYNAGTYYLGSRPVEALTDPTKFTFEIKSSGGTIAGDAITLTHILEDIQNVLKTY